MTTQIDTTPVAREITKLISKGTTSDAILTAVAHLFPDLTRAELSQALQDAVEQAQRQALRPH